ncbi:MAG TPA: hypothetical protein VFO83_05365, partial [Aggregicoccus sp.]|nr:hypothetical protein [Aggregicoccus sp.]
MSASRTARRASMLVGLLVGGVLAPEAASAAEAVLQVTAQVVSSARLQVPEPTPASLRTVEVPGGRYLVLALEAQVQRHGTSSGNGMTLSWRAAEEGSAEQALPVRFHPGRGGAWNRPGFGTALGAQAELAASGSGAELAVFVPETAQGAGR